MSLSANALIGGKWRLVRKIGGGSFGDIYLGQNMLTGDEVAIKLEPVTARHPQLLYESRVYRVLQVCQIDSSLVFSELIRSAAGLLVWT